MKRKKVIVEAGRVGADGVQIDLNGLGFVGLGHQIKVTNGFGGPVIGMADVTKGPEGLMAEISIELPKTPPLRGYPAVGGSVITSETNEAGVRVITGFELKEISISGLPNADPQIPPITL